MPADTDTPKFVAWQRLPGRRWEKVAEGDTAEEARAALWAVPFPGRARDVCVLPAHADPNNGRRLL